MKIPANKGDFLQQKANLDWIVDSSRQLFLGKVVENVKAIEDGEEVWKITISNNEGSLVSFFWQRNYNIIFKIRGERGPFNYDLQPPLNVLPLSTARVLALGSYFLGP